MYRFALQVALLGSCCLAPGCVGSAGGELLEFEAYAAGPAEAGTTEHRLLFTTNRGYEVELVDARLFVGGVYLNRSRPTSVSSDTSCFLAGIYVAEVTGGFEVDLLSATPQPFPERGYASTEPALTGEVWLSHGDINEPAAQPPILRVAGTAKRDGATYAFEGTLSIGQNRVAQATCAALPGAHPICKQRVVSPIPLELTAKPGHHLLLRVDPRGMFGNVDFSTLGEGDTKELYRFADETGANQASDNLYSGMRKSLGVYSFSWVRGESQQ